MKINYRGKGYKDHVRELLASECGLYHRSNRPIEPEAVFVDIKHYHGFKRLHMKGNNQVNVEFGLVALAHNLGNYINLSK